MAKATAGDRPSLELLLLTNAPMLSRHIAGRLPPLLRGSVTVEDILQETLLQTFLEIQRDKLKHTSHVRFCAWLKAIADMRLLDALKAQRRIKRGGQMHQVREAAGTKTNGWSDLMGQLPDDASTASHRLARKEAVLAIQIGMASLPRDQREAIRLHIIEGNSLEETADRLDRTTSAVRSLIHRGKQRLAETLGRASLWLSSR